MAETVKLAGRVVGHYYIGGRTVSGVSLPKDPRFPDVSQEQVLWVDYVLPLGSHVEVPLRVK